MSSEHRGGCAYILRSILYIPPRVFKCASTFLLSYDVFLIQQKFMQSILNWILGRNVLNNLALPHVPCRTQSIHISFSSEAQQVHSQPRSGNSLQTETIRNRNSTHVSRELSAESDFRSQSCIQPQRCQLSEAISWVRY